MACFQFAVGASTTGKCGIRLGPPETDRHEALRGKTTIYELLPVHVEANNNGGMRSGVGRRPPGPWRHHLLREAPFDVAEALVETDSLALQPGRTAAVLVEVSVDADATPGLYRSVVRFEQGERSVEAPFSFEVRKTVLPTDGGLHSTYWLSPIPANLTTGTPPAWWSEDHWRLLENSARVLRAYGQDSIKTPLVTGPDPLIRPVRDSQGKLSFDFTRFDRWCEMFLKLGFQRIEGSHISGGYTYNPASMAGGLFVWDEALENCTLFLPAGKKSGGSARVPAYVL